MALWLTAVAVPFACTGEDAPRVPENLVLIPGGTVRLGSAAAPDEGGVRSVTLRAFAMGRYEVTVAQYCRFLNDLEPDEPTDHPQIMLRDGRHRPRGGVQDHAVAFVGFDEAEAYCRWLSQRLGRACRLPTADEWEYAARSGEEGAPYPWGWGHPQGRAAFDLDGPPRVGLYPANAQGLYDMAGGVAEWCSRPGDAGTVRGGSWAERDPEQLTVYGGARLPRSYRDADVGFRIVAPWEGGGGVAPAQARP